MGWTSKMNASRHPYAYDNNRKLRKNAFFREPEKKEHTQSEDTKHRKAIIKELEERCKAGEDLDEVAKEIEARPETKEQFAYFYDNGFTSEKLVEVFKNLYLSKQNSRERNNTVNNIR